MYFILDFFTWDVHFTQLESKYCKGVKSLYSREVVRSNFVDKKFEQLFDKITEILKKNRQPHNGLHLPSGCVRCPLSQFLTIIITELYQGFLSVILILKYGQE